MKKYIFEELNERWKQLTRSIETRKIIIEINIERNWDNGENGYIYCIRNKDDLEEIRKAETERFNGEIKKFIEDVNKFVEDGGTWEW